MSLVPAWLLYLPNAERLVCVLRLGLDRVPVANGHYKAVEMDMI